MLGKNKHLNIKKCGNKKSLKAAKTFRLDEVNYVLVIKISINGPITKLEHSTNYRLQARPTKPIVSGRLSILLNKN